jgi:hypothetical protein
MHFQHEVQAYPISVTSETKWDPRDRPPSENVLLGLLKKAGSIAFDLQLVAYSEEISTPDNLERNRDEAVSLFSGEGRIGSNPLGREARKARVLRKKRCDARERQWDTVRENYISDVYGSYYFGDGQSRSCTNRRVGRLAESLMTGASHFAIAVRNGRDPIPVRAYHRPRPLEPVTSVDVTAADAVCELDNTLHAAGFEMCFAEMKDPVKDKLKRFGLFTLLGEQTFFAILGEAMNAYLATHPVEWWTAKIARRSARYSAFHSPSARSTAGVPARPGREAIREVGTND